MRGNFARQIKFVKHFPCLFRMTTTAQLCIQWSDQVWLFTTRHFVLGNWLSRESFTLERKVQLEKKKNASQNVKKWKDSSFNPRSLLAVIWPALIARVELPPTHRFQSQRQRGPTLILPCFFVPQTHNILLHGRQSRLNFNSAHPWQFVTQKHINSTDPASLTDWNYCAMVTSYPTEVSS